MTVTHKLQGLSYYFKQNLSVTVVCNKQWHLYSVLPTINWTLKPVWKCYLMIFKIRLRKMNCWFWFVYVIWLVSVHNITLVVICAYKCCNRNNWWQIGSRWVIKSSLRWHTTPPGCETSMHRTRSQIHDDYLGWYVKMVEQDRSVAFFTLYLLSLIGTIIVFVLETCSMKRQ